jgi:hypothetical protein
MSLASRPKIPSTTPSAISLSLRTGDHARINSLLIFVETWCYEMIAAILQISQSEVLNRKKTVQKSRKMQSQI